MQEVAHQLRDLFSRRLQEEVASVEEMNLGVVRVLAERAGTVGAENRVALAHTASTGTPLPRRYS